MASSGRATGLGFSVEDPAIAWDAGTGKSELRAQSEAKVSL